MPKINLLSSRLTVFFLLIILGFFVNLKYQQHRQEQAIELEKSELLAQADSLERKNLELQQSLELINSSGFKEKVARQQLNLKKTGEEIYSFIENPLKAGQPDSRQGSSSQKNWQKWLEYFLDTKPDANKNQ